MTEEAGAKRIRTGQHQPHRMPDRFEHRAEQDGHVVAIAGPEREHPAGRVQYLDPIGIPGVPHVPLHPFEQGLDLAQVVLGPDTARKQNVDGVLPDVEILGALPNQSPDVLRSAHGARVTAGDAA